MPIEIFRIEERVIIAMEKNVKEKESWIIKNVKFLNLYTNFIEGFYPPMLMLLYLSGNENLHWQLNNYFF